MKIILASSNAGKMSELSTLLSHLPIELISQKEYGVSDVAETGCTFVENALLKARHACRATGLPAIADDSGLVVDALNGAPGIYSARYAGPGAHAKDNIAKLLSALQDVPKQKRQASFHCVLVYMVHEKDPAPFIGHGRWDGSILTEPCGKDGFGYDPIFYVPGEGKSAAELSLTSKNRLSHRGQASRLLMTALSR